MKIAIVTGASSGIGREFVYALDRSTHLDEIWVIARREQKLNEIKKECSTPIRAIPMDLSLPESLESCLVLLQKEQPEIQYLVNAAGIGLFGPFTDMELDPQLSIIQLNTIALTAICHLCIPYMPQGSHIVNLASNSSWQPVPYINVYGASKSYVLNFSRALNMELKSRNIHVMAVAPGWIKTEFFTHAVHDDTISYYDRFYTARQVADKAMKDLKKNKTISILGFPVRMQVLAVKFLPTSLIMKIWCRQQKK